MTITSSEFNADMNMQTDTVIEEMVMADLDTDSVYVKMGISVVPFMTYEFTQIQVGELVNVHYTMGGMMAGENAGMGSYQTRDATPDVMETISSLVSASDAGEAGDEMELGLPTCDVSDLSSEMPVDAEPVITYGDETGVQTMTIEYTNDTGHDISIVTLIDDNEDLMSFEISTDYGSRNAPGSASSSCSYTAMWGDAVVIEVDDTLPRTSIPINFHVEGMPEDNWDDDDDDDDDTFYCDNGNEISRDLVDDGWDDCGDGSDESDDGGDDDDPDPEQMMDYMDTDDDGYLSLQELIDYLNNDREQNGEEPMSSEDEEGTANWFYSGDTDGDDLLSLDEFTQLLESTGDDDGGDDGNDVYWQSYEGGHCEWEGDADGEENAWYCKYEEETEWNTWWYYCENHDSDWHCTDDFGQSEDYEHSADGTEWCESFDCGDDGDDDGAPTPEEAMEAADANEDGYVSLQEFEDFWESDPSNPELDSDAIATLFDDCDYDGNDLIDIDEVQCFIDGVVDMFGPGEATPEQIFDWMDANDDGQVTASEWADFDNQTGGEGEEMSEEDFDGLSDIIDMFDDDDSGGLDWYEFEIFWAFCCADDDDGDDGDGEGGDDEPFRVTMMVMGQTLNAPISDFEVRFLVDCGEPDEEGNEPPISDCTVAASNGLTEGSATVDPAIAEYEFTYEYLDYDGDGLISDMDTLVIDNLMPGVQVELYDTWADQYTSESFATAEMLPGFGALMAVVVLLGAALATRRD